MISGKRYVVRYGTTDRFSVRLNSSSPISSSSPSSRTFKLGEMPLKCHFSDLTNRDSCGIYNFYCVNVIIIDILFEKFHYSSNACRYACSNINFEKIYFHDN